MKLSERIAAVSRDCIGCDQCGQTNPQYRCSRCTMKYYCSRECQKFHWKSSHKSKCVSKEFAESFLTNARKKVAEAALSDDSEPQKQLSAINNECAICLADPIKDPVILEECKHAFCAPCLIQWQYPNRIICYLLERNRVTCPCCRTKAPDAIGTLLTHAQVCISRANLLKGGTTASEEEEKAQHYKDALEYVDRALTVKHPHLLAYTTKADILISMGEPSKAIHTLDVMLSRIMDLSKVQNTVLAVKERSDRASASGDVAKATELRKQCIDMLDEFGIPSLSVLGYNEESVLDTFFMRFEAWCELGNWNRAMRDMKDCMNQMNEMSSVDKKKYRERIMVRFSRCYYEINAYEESIACANAVVKSNPHLPGARKYLVLSHKALGNMDVALTEAKRAVLYEPPWHEKSKLAALELYEEIRDELSY